MQVLIQIGRIDTGYMGITEGKAVKIIPSPTNSSRTGKLEKSPTNSYRLDTVLGLVNISEILMGCEFLIQQKDEKWGLERKKLSQSLA